MRRFYGAYLFIKSANSILKILIDCSFLRNDFENQFLRNYSIATTKKNSTILHSQFNYHTLPVTPFKMQQYFLHNPNLWTIPLRTGFGKMVYPDGAEFSGIWDNGVHVEFRFPPFCTYFSPAPPFYILHSFPSLLQFFTVIPYFSTSHTGLPTKDETREGCTEYSCNFKLCLSLSNHYISYWWRRLN